MKRTIFLIIISTLIISIALITFSTSDTSETQLEIKKLTGSSMTVGTNKNCIAFATYGYLNGKSTSPGLKCYYDTNDGKIKKTLSGTGAAECHYICSDSPNPIGTLQDIEIGFLPMVKQGTTKKFIGKERNCIGVVNNFCRSWNWIEFSCTYDKTKGEIIAKVSGSENSAYCDGKPSLSCGYICIDN